MTDPSIDRAPHGVEEASPPLTLERLSRMSQQEVDDLPYGFIVMNEQGSVLLYNRYEQQMSRLPAERVVGKNFFRDIAPCTRVEAFHGRFLALFKEPVGATARFLFRFHFLHGVQDVSIQFALVPGERVFMTVHRRTLTDEGGSPLTSARGPGASRASSDRRSSRHAPSLLSSTRVCSRRRLARRSPRSALSRRHGARSASVAHRPRADRASRRAPAP